MAKQLIPERLGEVIVGDITYIPIQKDSGQHDFCYLNLIMDSHTKIIIGRKVAPTLEKEYSIMALQQAHAFLTNHGVDTSHTIHHTDRGVQYASCDYVEQLSLYRIFALFLAGVTSELHPPSTPARDKTREST